MKFCILLSSRPHREWMRLLWWELSTPIGFCQFSQDATCMALGLRKGHVPWVWSWLSETVEEKKIILFYLLWWVPGWGPYFSRASYKWMSLSRLKVLHCAHCTSSLSFVRLTCLFCLKTKFYSPGGFTLDLLCYLSQNQSDPGPGPVSHSDFPTPAHFWTQTGNINAQIKSKSHNTKPAELGSRILEELTLDPQKLWESSQFRGPTSTYTWLLLSPGGCKGEGVSWGSFFWHRIVRRYTEHIKN